MSKTFLTVIEMRDFLATQKVYMASEWIRDKHLSFYAIPDGTFVVIFSGQMLYRGVNLAAAVEAFNTTAPQSEPEQL